MYDAQSFFVDNPINLYNIAAWMPLKYNKDGSLDVYVQRDMPGKDKEANWLPAAKDEFSLTMRVYWPKPASSTVLGSPRRCGPSRRGKAGRRSSDT